MSEQRRREAVRIVEGERVAPRIGDLELVGQRQGGVLDDALEQPGRMDERELDPERLDDDRLGHRAQRADDDAAAALGALVGAQQRVRVVVLARDEPVDVGGDAHVVTSLSKRRAIPATGIGTQSGRLLSS